MHLPKRPIAMQNKPANVQKGNKPTNLHSTWRGLRSAVLRLERLYSCLRTEWIQNSHFPHSKPFSPKNICNSANVGVPSWPGGIDTAGNNGGPGTIWPMDGDWLAFVDVLFICWCSSLPIGSGASKELMLNPDISFEPENGKFPLTWPLNKFMHPTFGSWWNSILFIGQLF